MAISHENRVRFEKVGLEVIRMDYVNGSTRVIRPENRAEAMEWISEQESKTRSRENGRYRLMLFLTAIAAIGAFIAAAPVIAGLFNSK